MRNVSFRSSTPPRSVGIAAAEGMTADDAANAALLFGDGTTGIAVSGDVGEAGEGAINEARWGIWGWDTTEGTHSLIDADHKRGGNPQDGCSIQASCDMFVTAADAGTVVDDLQGGNPLNSCVQVVAHGVTQGDCAFGVEAWGTDGGN